MSYYIAFLGAPGSGKGTQSKKIASHFDFPIIATGDLIRKEIADRTPMGLKVGPLIQQGKLVLDSDIITIFKDSLTPDIEASGFISDGFPRTLRQAELFDEVLSKKPLKTIILYLEVVEEKLKKRLLGREICDSCNRVYHENFNPPVKEGVCDVCGTLLVNRTDDTLDIILNRINIYNKQIQPVLDYFSDRVYRIDGDQTPELVHKQIMEALS